MKKLRIAAAIPVILAMILAFSFHRTASASPHRTHQESELAPFSPTQTTSLDVEGFASWCDTGGFNCFANNTPNSAGFYDCGADTSGCTEAWVDADGQLNGNRGGRPRTLSAGCGHSFTDGFGRMHFQYASLNASSLITGVALIIGDTGDRNVDTQAFINAGSSGTLSNPTQHTSFTVVSEHNSAENLAHINNYHDTLLAGGFKISFKGIIDQTLSGESGSGGFTNTYLPNGTINCMIDASNTNFDKDFDAEVE